MSKVNDLATSHPELAEQWHPTKNGDLTPEMVTADSNKKVWWLLPYDDPVTGKHFDFEWEATPNNRVDKGMDCPYLAGKAVWPGFNDLVTANPQLAKEWHPTKNSDLTPEMVTADSNKQVWWLLRYDDPVTGKHFDFEWEAAPNSRSNGNDCPYLAGKAVWPGFNDLVTANSQNEKNVDSFFKEVGKVTEAAQDAMQTNKEKMDESVKDTTTLDKQQPQR